MKIHRIAKWFISFRRKDDFLLFAFQRGRWGWFFNGRLPARPWTYRFRIGPFEIERTRYEDQIT